MSVLTKVISGFTVCLSMRLCLTYLLWLGYLHVVHLSHLRKPLLDYPGLLLEHQPRTEGTLRQNSGISTGNLKVKDLAKGLASSSKCTIFPLCDSLSFL